MNCNSNASNPSCCLMLVHPIIYEIAEEEGQGKGQGESSASGGGKGGVRGGSDSLSSIIVTLDN